MKLEQCRWTKAKGWQGKEPGQLGNSAQMVLLFGNPSIMEQKRMVGAIKEMYPCAILFGCSTSGEICGTGVRNDSLTLTAVHLERTAIDAVSTSIDHMNKSVQVGKWLGRSLQRKGLVHVLVLSDGLHVNGTALVKGLTRHLPASVTVTGGLAGDGNRFEKTYVLLNDTCKENYVAVVGFYGEALKVGHGSMGGLDPFGPERLITKSKGNILYEFDGKSALNLYRKYLGEHASGLPATALLFPLTVRPKEDERGVVRTVLSIDEKTGGMTFAGDVPEGSYARLMKANFDRLIDGAVAAAKASAAMVEPHQAELALLISCEGRKLILNQRIEEEVEGVRDVLGEQCVLTGFYSYGEVSPSSQGAKCELHNQTMTVTTFSEVHNE